MVSGSALGSNAVVGGVISGVCVDGIGPGALGRVMFSVAIGRGTLILRPGSKVRRIAPAPGGAGGGC